MLEVGLGMGGRARLAGMRGGMDAIWKMTDDCLYLRTEGLRRQLRQLFKLLCEQDSSVSKDSIIKRFKEANRMAR